MTRPERVILGIDPGTNLMGYGVLRVQGGRAEALALGVIDLRKMGDGYLKLGHIFERVTGIIQSYLPDEVAIEAPFFGKNVQSMLKLGRAQGVAIAAAIQRQVPITEYAPMKIKMALTGTGSASKEQVAGMLQRILRLDEGQMAVAADATDALAAAYCHYLQLGRPQAEVNYRSWADYVRKNGTAPGAPPPGPKAQGAGRGPEASTASYRRSPPGVWTTAARRIDDRKGKALTIRAAATGTAQPAPPAAATETNQTDNRI